MTRTHSPEVVHQRRWLILGVLCLSLFLIVVDNTIINVALPRLVRELGATTTQLQWIVDAYSLVFAGLLLAAGSLGDRFGRKRALSLGLVLFAGFSTLGSFASSPGQLIAARAAMGIGAALIFPATLAILANVFTNASERAKAIGIWTAVTGAAVALGPITGGFLLEHFWWGSVLLVNLPISGLAFVLGRRFVPDSRDPAAPRLDLAGLGLSIGAVTSLVYTIVEAPRHGWTSTETVAGFAVAAVLLVAFVRWEQRVETPMLDVSIFSNARFSAASLSVTLAFFALFGFIFMVTQYLQFVKGYGTLAAGVRTVPFAVAVGIASPISAKLAARIGSKVVVAGGLLSMAGGFLVAHATNASTHYSVIVVAMAFMGGGLGLTTAPATESIMGSLPPEKAGVGSAVNDTTRELGGTLGVAVVGSLMTSVYAARLTTSLSGQALPPAAAAKMKESLGAAVAVADRVGGTTGQALHHVAASAFVDGFQAGSLVAAGVVSVGALLALVWLPSRAHQRVADFELIAQPALDG